jgi:hypothetical protein
MIYELKLIVHKLYCISLQPSLMGIRNTTIILFWTDRQGKLLNIMLSGYILSPNKARSTRFVARAS